MAKHVSEVLIKDLLVLGGKAYSVVPTEESPNDLTPMDVREHGVWFRDASVFVGLAVLKSLVEEVENYGEARKEGKYDGKAEVQEGDADDGQDG